MKLNIKAFALACGIFWGAGVFIGTWWVVVLDEPGGTPGLIGRLYRGYSLSPRGSLIGLIWAFFTGMLGGAIFAWLYNKLTERQPFDVISK